jgi:hypothetical protein
MSYNLYIDDLRVCPYDNFVVVRSSASAILHMKMNGCPHKISFDHDLGGDDTSMIVVKWMVEQDMKTSNFFRKDFNFSVHSANPIGAANLNAYLKSYLNNKK